MEYSEVKANAEKFLTLEQVKQKLMEDYNYPEQYVRHIPVEDLWEEYAYSVCENTPGHRFQYPHHLVGLPDGRTIDHKGNIERDPKVELTAKYGYTVREVVEMEWEEVLELWCKLEGLPLPENYLKQKAKKAKKKHEEVENTGLLKVKIKKFKP